MSDSTIEKALAEVSWCDLQLLGFAWIEDGRDLQLSLLHAGSGPYSSRTRSLICRWTSNLRVDLAYTESMGGYPLSWDVEFERTSQGGWKVFFDFAGTGGISFRCSELRLI